ncbi:MAG TPA: hypothetical protein VES95_13525 [Dermatophilaceae bacterium]|nr:hypothetical protein [Dermatophilaceae bacterium]
MTENPNAEQAAATEAAQHVVDEVTSWNYSSERDTIESELDEGLDAAGVEMGTGEKERIVEEIDEEIDELKQDETAGKPQVESAEAAEG